MKKEKIDVKSFRTYKMESQVAYSVCAEIPKAGVFRRKTPTIEAVMSVEGSRDNKGEVCPGHIHMLVSIPPKMSDSGFMGYLKGTSALLIFQKYRNKKFAYRNREFWCKGYYVDTVGKNTKAMKVYIAEQLKRDNESDQLSRFDPWQANLRRACA